MIDSMSPAVNCVKLSDTTKLDGSTISPRHSLKSVVRTCMTSLRRENFPRTGAEEWRPKSALNERTISSNFSAPANRKLVWIQDSQRRSFSKKRNDSPEQRTARTSRNRSPPAALRSCLSSAHSTDRCICLTLSRRVA
jgi:hypothetical protein